MAVVKILCTLEKVPTETEDGIASLTVQTAIGEQTIHIVVPFSSLVPSIRVGDHVRAQKNGNYYVGEVLDDNSTSGEDVYEITRITDKGINAKNTVDDTEIFIFNNRITGNMNAFHNGDTVYAFICRTDGGKVIAKKIEKI